MTASLLPPSSAAWSLPDSKALTSFQSKPPVKPEVLIQAVEKPGICVKHMPGFLTD